MARDPRKRITGIILLSDEDRLVFASKGLTEEQAGLLCNGFVDGLRESGELPEYMLAAFLKDPRAMAALEIPGDMNAAERELFKRGAVGGMRVAAAGFWLDVTESFADGRVLH